MRHFVKLIPSLFLLLMIMTGSPLLGDSTPQPEPETSSDNSLLGGTLPNVECRNPLYNPSCKTDMELEECEANGGRWVESFGLIGRPACLCPTIKGGCPCRSPRDCEQGLCMQNRNLAGTYTCAAVHPMVGCIKILTEEGTPVMLCID
jgi:hypothetical protein